MTVGEALVQKVKALSGTAVSDQERALISQISLPSIKDDDAIFKAKLKRAMDTIEKAKQVRIDSFKKQGKDPSKFEANSANSDMVKMQIPDGRVKMIPRDKVEAAKKAGAKEI